MSKATKTLGKIISLDPISKTASVKFDLLDSDTLASLEFIANTKQSTEITFNEPYSPSKTYEQLKRYYAMLKAILLSFNIPVNSKTMKTLDQDTKERALPCEFIIIDEQKIPVPPPSKADMTVDQLNVMMAWLEKTYKKINWQAENWYK
jgi:uncharacterized glyoxalase superfamily metalloenzyme YdcJ